MDCVALKHKILEKYGVGLVKKIEEQLKLEHAISFETASDEFVDVIYTILENHISDDPKVVLDNDKDDQHKTKKYRIVLENHTELKEKITECMGDRNCLDILYCIADQYKTTYQIILQSRVNRSNAYRKIELLESVGLIEKKNIHQSKMYSYTTTFESITIDHHQHSNKIIIIPKNEKSQKKFMSLQKNIM